MGAKLVSFEIKPDKNEQIEAFVRIPEETRSVIHGIVKDYNNEYVKDAVVKLFEKRGGCDNCNLKPIAHTFTDECGQFIFGPLIPNKQYVIKVWVNRTKIRNLIVTPDDCDDIYDEWNDCYDDNDYDDYDDFDHCDGSEDNKHNKECGECDDYPGFTLGVEEKDDESTNDELEEDIDI